MPHKPECERLPNGDWQVWRLVPGTGKTVLATIRVMHGAPFVELSGMCPGSFIRNLAKALDRIEAGETQTFSF